MQHAIVQTSNVHTYQRLRSAGGPLGSYGGQARSQASVVWTPFTLQQHVIATLKPMGHCACTLQAVHACPAGVAVIALHPEATAAGVDQPCVSGLADVQPTLPALFCSRRSTVMGFAGMTVALAAAALPAGSAQAAAAAAEGPCELQKAPNGLSWCDLQEGDGPEPFKGAFYK